MWNVWLIWRVYKYVCGDIMVVNSMNHTQAGQVILVVNVWFIEISPIIHQSKRYERNQTTWNIEGLIMKMPNSTNDKIYEIKCRRVLWIERGNTGVLWSKYTTKHKTLSKVYWLFEISENTFNVVHMLTFHSIKHWSHCSAAMSVNVGTCTHC